MMLQVTAAALVAELRVLGSPASTGSITTRGNKEVFVSMGMTSALKLSEEVKEVCPQSEEKSGFSPRIMALSRWLQDWNGCRKGLSS